MHTIRIPSRPVHPAPAPKPPRRRSWKKLVLLIILIATISTVALFHRSEAAYNPFTAIWQEIDKIKGRMNRIYSDGLKIKNDAVKGREIQNNSITSRKIKNRSIESQDLKSKIISSLRLIADNLITSEKIRNLTLRNEDIALDAGLRPPSWISPVCVNQPMTVMPPLKVMWIVKSAAVFNSMARETWISAAAD